MSPKQKTVCLGVGAGVAAFKAVALASLLTRHGLQVRVMMTEAAQEFVAPLSFTAVTGQTVITDSLSMDPDGVASHLKPAQADAFVVAPATADLIARLALGLASDRPAGAPRELLGDPRAGGRRGGDPAGGAAGLRGRRSRGRHPAG